MKKISESATTKTTISNKEKERKDMKRVEKNFNLAEEQKVCNVVIRLILKSKVISLNLVMMMIE